MFWRLFAKWNVPVKAAYLNPGFLLPSPGTDDAVTMRDKPGKPLINRLELSGSRLFLILSEFYFASTLYRASYSFVKSPHFAHLCSVAIDIFLEYHYN